MSTLDEINSRHQQTLDNIKALNDMAQEAIAKWKEYLNKFHDKLVECDNLTRQKNDLLATLNSIANDDARLDGDFGELAAKRYRAIARAAIAKVKGSMS